MQIDERRMSVEREMDDGENLLWVGSPDAKRMMLPSLAGFGFGIVWMSFVTNFVYMWNQGPRNAQGPGGMFGMQGILANVFFVPFILIGTMAILSPIWFYRNAKKTIYGVSDRRVLVVENGRVRKVRSWKPRDISDIRKSERANGSGDLAFGRLSTDASDSTSCLPAVQFVGIPDVRTVERLVYALAERHDQIN